MAKMGRPQRPYETSWGEMVPGLYRCPDGRWRITATGRKFTEADERRAVSRFRATQQPATVDVPTVYHEPADDGLMERLAGGGRLTKIPLPGVKPAAEFLEVLNAPPRRPHDTDEPIADHHRDRVIIKADQFWPWLRELVISKPEYVAKMIGIPELANLKHLPLPKPAITIEQLVETYETQSPSKPQTKATSVRTIKKLARFANAKTVEDLTQEQLLRWRDKVENDPNLTSAGTRAGYYGQVKTVLGFGMKAGLDQVQLRAALDRCKVLWTAEPLPPVNPQPISREDYHTLLDASNDTWRAWLLLAMNLAMTSEDLCQMEWSDFDMEAGTYAAIRVKTRRDRIPRAGVLWDETMEAMQRLPRRSEYVFTSARGAKYNKNSRVNLFAKLRARVGLPETVKMSHIRDAAYTSACQGTGDERWARVLAGHRAPGLQDNYVLRNPEAVRPACEAVYRAFGPFPEK